jgi:hypothetical protein
MSGSSPIFEALPGGWFSVYKTGKDKEKLFIQSCPGVITWKESKAYNTIADIGVMVETKVAYGWLGPSGKWQDASAHPDYVATIYLGTGIQDVTADSLREILKNNGRVL